MYLRLPEQTTSSAYPFMFTDEAGATAYGQFLSREERAALDVVLRRLAWVWCALAVWPARPTTREAWLSAYRPALQDARDGGFAVPDIRISGANPGAAGAVPDNQNHIREQTPKKNGEQKK